MTNHSEVSNPFNKALQHQMKRRRLLQVLGAGGALGLMRTVAAESVQPGSTMAGQDASAAAEMIDNALYRSVTESIPKEEVEKRFYSVPLEPVNLMPPDASMAKRLEQNYRCFVCREKNNYPPIPDWETFKSLFSESELDNLIADAEAHYKGNKEGIEAKTIKVYLDSLIKQGVIKIAYEDETDGSYVANKPDNWLTNIKKDLYTFGTFYNVLDVGAEGNINGLWLDGKSRRKDAEEIVKKAKIENDKVLCMSMHTSLSAFNDIAQGLNPNKDVLEWTERKWHLIFDKENEAVAKLFPTIIQS